MRPFLACACALALLAAAPAGARVESGTRMVVGFVAGTSETARASALSAAGATQVAELGEIRAVVASGPPSAVAALQADPSVAYARTDGVSRTLAAPTDPGYTGDGWAWGTTTTGLDAVWPVTSGDAGITIAVLDTGIDASHPDFAGKILPGYDFANEDTDPDDDVGHGTEVAGAAVALDDGANAIGACPRCSVLPVKIFDAGGTTTSSAIARGILWALEQGADVINLSYGGYVQDPVESAAVAYAVSRGVVVVAAAGNDAIADVGYPAKLPGVIAVAAIDDAESTALLASWSNFGPDVDVAAPGNLLSSADGGGTAAAVGTSFAAPVVAGAAGLLLGSELHPSSAAVVTALTSGSRTVGGLPLTNPSDPASFTPYRLFDGFAAFGSLAPVAAPALVTPFVSTGGAARVGQSLWARTGDWTPAATSFAYQWRRCDAIGAACVDVAGATASSLKLTGADLGSTIRVRVSASNAAGTTTADSFPSAVVKAASDAPAPTVAPSLSGSAVSGKTLTLSPGSWSGSPTFAYAWQRCDASGFACTGVGGTGTSYTLSSADVGSRIRAVVTATNADGAEVGDAFSATVTATAATVATGSTDVAVSLVSSAPRASRGDTVTLTATATAKGATAARATLTLLLPDALAAESAASSKGLCLAYGNRIDCEVGPLGPGASATVTVLASVLGEGALVVRASTRTEPADASAANDTASLTLRVGESTTVRVPADAPTLAGNARVGSTLRVRTGRTVAAAGKTTITWQACRGSRCSTLAGKRGPSLRVARAHVGRRLRAIVASGGTRRATALSAVVRV